MMDAPEQAVCAAVTKHGCEMELPDYGPCLHWCVMVVCREPSHEKPREIGTFTLVFDPDLIREFNEGSECSLPPWEYRQRKRRRRAVAAYNRRRPDGQYETFADDAQYLVGNRLLPHVGDGSENHAGFEIRYPLRCGACDLSVPWRWRQPQHRSEDELQLLLDEYAIAGKGEITLSAIVARLNSR
jgi:hypothetical protein